MRPTSHRLFQALAVAALLFVSISFQTAVAQTPDAGKAQAAPAEMKPELLSITVVSVKPDMVADFQNFMVNETNPGLRKGGVKWRDVWVQTPLSGDAFEYTFVGPLDNFATLDGPSALEKGLGKDGFAAWLTKAGRLVTGVRRFVIRTRPDLSSLGKKTGPPKLAVATSIIVAPGHGQDFENYLKNDYLPVVKKTDATYLVAVTLFGGDVNEFHTLTMRDSFSELDKGPIANQVLGDEGAMKLMQKIPAGTIVHQERSLIRFVPELSIAPVEAPK